MYDNQGSWQAGNRDLESPAIQKHVDKNSFSTQHYVFLAGQNLETDGILGIAYIGTPCIRQPNGMSPRDETNKILL